MRPIPAALVHGFARLRYILHITGSMRGMIPLGIIRSAIPVTNWGDAPAGLVAESTLALLLACLKNIRPQIQSISQGGWTEWSWKQSLSTLDGLRLGIYGFGFIAKRFAQIVAPLGPEIIIYDPIATDLPEHEGVSALWKSCSALARQSVSTRR